jgi:hypothetical protein
MPDTRDQGGLLDGFESLSAPDLLRRTEPSELLAAIDALSRLRTRLDQWEPMLIDAARERGLTWAQIAPALGVASRQAAERRYLRLKPQPDGVRTTREARVDATRHERSAERAVATWARSQAAALRQLAGQIAALPTSGRARASAEKRTAIDQVRRVLASDDAAELVQPLTAAGESLRDEHPRLAEQISALTATADKIRDTDRSRRTGPEPTEADNPD